MSKAHVVSTGYYLPKKIVFNKDLQQFPKVAQLAIGLKTGIEARRHASAEETVSYMGAQAALDCLHASNIDAMEIDCIIVATSSPEKIQPPTAALVQERIGAQASCAFDVNAVCSGSIYGIAIATSFIESGMFKNVLLVSSEKYTSFLNPKDISTYPYFGDGAAAILLSYCSNEDIGVLSTVLHTDGQGSNLIQIPAGGSLSPGWGVNNSADFYFSMNGQAVYGFVEKILPEVLHEVCVRAKTPLSSINKIIPHQANEKMLKTIFQKLHVDRSKVYINVKEVGNTASASPLIALHSVILTGEVKTGDTVALVAFGGGLSWGATIIKL